MVEEASVGIVQTQYFTFAAPPDEFELECGRKLGPITLAYETYGQLDASKTNAVLIAHALSGDAHAAGYHTPEDRTPGWWDRMIGPGKGFDTRRYFVVCSNVLGGCQGSTGPSSIDPATGEPYGLTFPIITIGDMVRCQKRLLEHLGIEVLLAVAGGSMGGMQVLEWATRYPDMIRSAIVIASSHMNSAQSIAFDAVGRHAIQADAAFDGGSYYRANAPTQGLAIARMLGHITYLSDETMHAKFGRTLRAADAYRYDLGSEFSVETYLDYQGEKFVDRFDANSYLYITKAIDYFDLTGAHGALDNAMARVRGRMLVLSYSSDWLYPPYQSRQIVDALTRQGKDVTYCNVQSDYGHDGFLLEVDVMKRIIGGFLRHVYEPGGCCRVQMDEPEPPPAGPDLAYPYNVYQGHRLDYDTIVGLVEERSRVLDIGCGDGELLCRLIAAKNVDATGIELAQDSLVHCVRRGISVIQADADKGLAAFPEQSYDYVVLSMTLQVVKRPDIVIREMLRVGKKCIVSFPNFGYWKVRAKLLLSGRAPITRSLPYTWDISPNRHFLSIKDFRGFCRAHNARIEKEIALSCRGQSVFLANLLADEAVFVLSAQNRL